MYMIEISEDKVDNILECMNKGIKSFGKAMDYLEEARGNYDEEEYDEEEDDDEDEEDYRPRKSKSKMKKERRTSKGSGRYSHY